MRILLCFGYWNPMGFIPKFCLTKTLGLVGNLRTDDEEAIGNVQMDGNSKKAMDFICLIKQRQVLALTACDASGFLRRRADVTWYHGQEDLSEWCERKGDDLCQLANDYEKRVLNLKRLLKELIETSDQPLTSPINWEVVVVLPFPLFHKLF